MDLETRKKISDTLKNKGIKPPNRKGAKMTKEAIEKIKNSLKGNKRSLGFKHSKETREKLSKIKKGKRAYICTEETRKKFSERMKNIRGKNHPNWRGGKTNINDLIRGSLNYREWRDFVFKRDNYTCKLCGDKTGGNLEADHIKPFSLILIQNNIKTFEEAIYCLELWDINNGRTLCNKCHRKTDTYGGISKKRIAEWGHMGNGFIWDN